MKKANCKRMLCQFRSSKMQAPRQNQMCKKFIVGSTYEGEGGAGECGMSFQTVVQRSQTDNEFRNQSYPLKLSLALQECVCMSNPLVLTYWLGVAVGSNAQRRGRPSRQQLCQSGNFCPLEQGDLSGTFSWLPQRHTV